MNSIPHSTTSSIGERIRSARKQAGITRLDLATSVGVSVQAIGFWETDVNEPRCHHLKALCKALNIEYSDRLSIAASAGSATTINPLLHELMLAELIINTLQNVLTDEQRLLVGAQLAAAGLQGNTPTRSAERRAAITAAGTA